MANGLAGDVVTAAALATSAPVVVAPAMDGDMWTHPATVANVARLRDVFGYTVVAPESGPLASGQSGIGPARRAAGDRRRGGRRRRRAARSASRTRPRARRSPTRRRARPTSSAARIVITAGGTREPIDPVRYIGNRSTGKMGVALAEAALARGAAVTLIAAAVEVPLPGGRGGRPRRVDRRAPRRAPRRRWPAGRRRPPAADALVMAAAVADFTPAAPSDREDRAERRA